MTMPENTDIERGTRIDNIMRDIAGLSAELAKLRDFAVHIPEPLMVQLAGAILAVSDKWDEKMAEAEKDEGETKCPT